MVALNRIYTRTGDKGTTGLASGERRKKHDLRVEAYGTVDETNACVGLARLHTEGEVDAMLSRIQNELFDLGADLSVPFAEADGKLRITQAAIDRLEADCDEANAQLPELRSFVLPGGTEAAARLHVARAVCRSAEREVLGRAAEAQVNPLAPVYLNRLSDLLFILARAANAGGAEPLWKPGG
ncbi:MAG: cob(I)yrinic acid a,c-diamide adenosyltransferase [Microvirga sp.]